MGKWLLLMVMLTGTQAVSAGQGHGRVAIGGTILESACTIATDDVWQEIDFGSHPLKNFASQQREEVTRSFKLDLIHCILERDSGGEWKSVEVTFDGPRALNDPTLFSMTGTGKGVAMRITDKEGHKAIAGESLPPQPLTKDATRLDYQLHLVGTGEHLSAGELSTFLRFMVAYQ